MGYPRLAVVVSVVLGSLLTPVPASGQRIVSTELAKGVYMLQGQGGNIGLCVGEDGTFVIDDQFAHLSARILAHIGGISPDPVKFLVNTHWHGDHTGGNENFKKAGAIIVAHENVRKRMEKGQFQEAFKRDVPPAPAGALPVITFNEELTFHWNGQEIAVLHMPPAHTDGDAIVFFKKSNVIHMGDCYFNGLYPFIDPSSGGLIDGVIVAADRTLALCNDETKIVPGHGPASNAKELRIYRDVLETVRTRIDKLLADGKTVDEIVAAKPSAEFDAKWGNGFMKPEPWIRIVCRGIELNRAPKASDSLGQ